MRRMKTLLLLLLSGGVVAAQAQTALPDTGVAVTVTRAEVLVGDTAVMAVPDSMAMAQAIDEVVVSGTMRAVSKSQSPIPVEIYSQGFFKKNPTPNLFEGLSVVNGVQPQLNCNVCNTGDIHINGMEGPYTMVLIDGMPIVSSLSTVYGLSGIPMSLIRRIEVVKGPASTLYGSEAVGGLINIITKEPGSAPRFSADAWATSRAETNLDLGGTARWGKAHALIGANAYYYGTPHDVNSDGFTDVTQQQRISLFSKLRFDRPEGRDASLAVRLYAEDRWGGQLGWARALRGSDVLYAESIRTARAEIFGRYGLQVGRQPLTLEGSYNYHNQDSYYGTAAYRAVQHTGFVQLRGEKTFGAHTLLSGLPFRIVHYDDNTPATADASAGLTLLPGAFVQDEWRFADDWTALGGLRYEWHNVQGSILAPRAAVKWSPSPAHILRFSAGNGFRVVNLATEDHLALSGARRLVILETLKPERSWNGTLNYTGTATPTFGLLTFDGSLFYTYFSNRIVADYDTDPQLILYRNLQGHSVSRGVTVSADAALKNGLKALLGATFMDVHTVTRAADVERKSVQLFAPRVSATWVVSYAFRRAGIALDLTGKVYGPQRLPVVPGDYRPEYSPTFALANLQATKTWSNGWEVYAAAKNLLNFLPTGPILHPDDPFDRAGGKYFTAEGLPRADTNPAGYTFDPSYNYAPVQGLKALVGVRYVVK